MDSGSSLPFKVGQLAESKSFLEGYRGAWFRCKITDISCRKGHTGYSLEFYDYPDEKIKWTKLYQRPRRGVLDQRKECKMELMVRPSFPSFYHESKVASLGTISDVIVIVRDVWQLGDLVDWWYEGCYWSATVIKILGDDKLQIELPQPPNGEGNSYEVLSSDLRPSLEWSPKLGWTVPGWQGSETSQCCARVVRSLKEDELRMKSALVENMAAFSSCETESSISSNRSPISFPPLHDKEKREKDLLVDYDQGNTPFETPTSNSSNVSCGSLCPRGNDPHSAMESSKHFSDDTEHRMEVEVSSCPLLTPSDNVYSAVKENCKQISGSGGKRIENASVSALDGVADTSRLMNQRIPKKDRYSDRFAPKKTRISGSECSTSLTCADSVESSIMELEELANKVRWLKGLLKYGLSWTNTMKPSWKFYKAG